MLIISPDEDFSLSTSGTQQVGTQTASSVGEHIIGTWTAEGNTLTRTDYPLPSLPGQIAASYARGTLTSDRNGNIFVYQRG